MSVKILGSHSPSVADRVGLHGGSSAKAKKANQANEKAPVSHANSSQVQLMNSALSHRRAADTSNSSSLHWFGSAPSSPSSYSLPTKSDYSLRPLSESPQLLSTVG